MRFCFFAVFFIDILLEKWRIHTHGCSIDEFIYGLLGTCYVFPVWSDKKESTRILLCRLVYALYGTVIGGTAFGYLGFFTQIFQVSHDQYLQQLSTLPLHSNLLIFWAGPAFPLSLLILSVVLWRTTSAEVWVCMLLLTGAIAFPVSRILRIESIAHLADLFLAVPVVYTGIKPTRRHSVADHL